MTRLSMWTLALWSLMALGALRGLAQDGTYDWRQGRSLEPGIRHARIEVEKPRKMVTHAARIDAWSPEVKLHATGRRQDWVEGKLETDRRTTRDYLRQARKEGIPMALAINADAFAPWPAPYNESTPSDLQGLAVSEGRLVSRGAGTPSMLKMKSGELRIEVTDADFDSSDVQLAISGFGLCLDNGRALPSGADLHPRTGVGLSRDGRYLVLVVIDGRQPRSVGATTSELGEWLRYFGAERGINLDGGGSTTMAWWDRTAAGEDKCVLLNSPVGNGVRAEHVPVEQFVPTERANGNNLGISVETPRTTYDPGLYLFVDDRWIAERRGVTRIFQRARPLDEPIIWPDDPKTEADCAWGNVIRERDGRFRLWYCTMTMGHNNGGPHEMASAGVWGRGDDFTFRPRSEADRPAVESMLGKYAESDEGERWRKPKLGLIESRGSRENNIVLTGQRAAEQTQRALTNFDGYTIVRDDNEPRSERRYKMIAHWESVHFWDNHAVSGSLGRPKEYIDRCAAARGQYLTYSPDGLRWEQPLERVDMPTGGGDRLLVVPDPRHARWMAYVRAGGWSYPAFSFSRDLRTWSPAEPAKTITPGDVGAPAVECMIPFNYGNQYLAFPCGMDKPKGVFTVMVAGRHEDRDWSWVKHDETFIPYGPAGSYYATGAVPLHNEPFVVGDELFIYFNAFSRNQSPPSPFGNRSIGLAKLRRDGFAGLQAEDAGQGGDVRTTPLRMTGGQLCLNVEFRGEGGSVSVALLDEQGRELPGYGFAESRPVTSDAVRAPVRWKARGDVRGVRGQMVQVALRLSGGAVVYALAQRELAAGARESKVP